MIEHLHVWVVITAPFRAISLCHCFKCEHLGVMHTYVVRHVNNQKMGFGCTPLIPTTDQLCMYAHNWYMSLCGSLFGVGVGLTKVTIRYEQFAKYIINTSSVCRWRKGKFASLSNSCESDPITGSLLTSSAGTGKTREKFGLRVFLKSWTSKSHSD